MKRGVIVSVCWITHGSAAKTLQTVTDSTCSVTPQQIGVNGKEGFWVEINGPERQQCMSLHENFDIEHCLAKIILSLLFISALNGKNKSTESASLFFYFAVYMEYATCNQRSGLYKTLPRVLIIIHLTGTYFEKFPWVSSKAQVTKRTMLEDERKECGKYSGWDGEGG